MLSSEDVKDQGSMVFIVGAGISMDEPSRVPSAQEIAGVLLDLLLASPIDRSIPFDLIIDSFKALIDPDLKIFDFFDTRPPNSFHEIFARAINAGVTVFTTNFDNLIEKALLAILPAGKRKDILPIITLDDFKRYGKPGSIDPQSFPVFKIHGSKKNEITCEDTTSSLRFSTPFNKSAVQDFNEIIAPVIKEHVKGKNLVIFGYSGKDDDDINPCIEELARSGEIKKLIWFAHDPGFMAPALKAWSEYEFARRILDYKDRQCYEIDGASVGLVQEQYSIPPVLARLCSLMPGVYFNPAYSRAYFQELLMMFAMKQAAWKVPFNELSSSFVKIVVDDLMEIYKKYKELDPSGMGDPFAKARKITFQEFLLSKIPTISPLQKSEFYSCISRSLSARGTGTRSRVPFLGV
jgi:hypothetical protein